MNWSPAGEKEFECNGRGWYDGKGDELLGRKKTFPECIREDIKINMIGEKDDLPVHLCDKCDLPIKIFLFVRSLETTILSFYIRASMLFTITVLIYMKETEICLGYSIPVLQIEEHTQGSIFLCSFGQEYRKTYLSQREAKKFVTCAPLKKVHPCIASPTTEIPEMLLGKDHRNHIPPELCTNMSPPPVQCVSHKLSNQPHEDLHAPPAELAPPSPPLVHQEIVTPAHQHPDCQSQPEQHALPASPLPPVSHPVSHSHQDSDPPQLVHSQASPPPMTSDPSPVTSSPGCISALVPPSFLNSLPQFTEEQETLNLPFAQQNGTNPGVCPLSKGLSPPLPTQGPASPVPLSGSQHSD
ncbi:hypothetical protein FD755_016078 [Muntiacus reevesi]|uniref:Uncharacterized protein n=1 Tax=Muntiacus reevesi TaxID=9886 RepID=A0A5N3XGD5_MUNRE|nr:hypothetical protein FD755_016078 [Muntiacus reevesi]